MGEWRRGRWLSSILKRGGPKYHKLGSYCSSSLILNIFQISVLVRKWCSISILLITLLPLQNSPLTWYSSREFGSDTFIDKFLILDGILSKFDFLSVKGWNKLPKKVFPFTHRLEKRKGVLLHSNLLIRGWNISWFCSDVSLVNQKQHGGLDGSWFYAEIEMPEIISHGLEFIHWL